MFVIRGPYPTLQTTTLLPSPQFSDQEALRSTVKVVRSMNGTRYTYVTSREGLHKLKWDFRVARHKALELREFIDAYYAGLVQITDHNGDIWVGYLKNNPFEFVGQSRANGWPGDELWTVTLEFEER